MSEQTDTIADLLSNIRPCSCACPDHYRDVDREAAYLVEHGVRVVGDPERFDQDERDAAAEAVFLKPIA